ncbi:hypothetical protein MASR2M66_03130 [Chloroflexota bacterium]
MGNPFLVCSDRELRALPNQWLRAERWDKTGNLLYELNFMEAIVKRLGIDELLQEYDAALQLLPEGDWHNKLAKTSRLLRRQAHHLRNWDTEAQPTLFFQQFLNESLEFDLSELQVHAELYLTQTGLPYLSERFKMGRESPELLLTLIGHTDTVTSLDISADGKLVVSASSDGTIRIWSLSSGVELKTLASHQGAIKKVAITPDNRIVISASTSRSIKTWDVDSGREIHTLSSESVEIRITALAITPDGRFLFEGRESGRFYLWDINRGQKLDELAGHFKTVSDLCVTKDGHNVISASWDGTIKIWEFKNDQKIQLVKTLPVPKSQDTKKDYRFNMVAIRFLKRLLPWVGNTKKYYSFNAVAITPNGNLIVSNLDWNNLQVWSVETGEELKKLSAPSRGFQDVAISPDGKLVIAAGGAGLVVWDLITNEKLRTLYGHNDDITSVAVAPNSRLAVSASEDKTLKVWAINPEQKKRDSTLYSHGELTLNLDRKSEDEDRYFHNDKVNCVAITADGLLAVSASDDEYIKVWDISSGKLLRKLPARGSVTGLATTPDCQSILAAFSKTNGVVTLWDIKKGLGLFARRSFDSKVDIDTDYLYPKRSVVITSAAEFVISAAKNDIYVWDFANENLRYTLSGHSKFIYSLAASSDGRFIVSASEDKTIKVWSLIDGRELRTLLGHKDSVYAVTISHDNKYIASLSGDRMLKVWDFQSGQEINAIEMTHVKDKKISIFLKEQNNYCDVVITPDNRFIISIFGEETLDIWDIANGKRISTITANAPFTCLALSLDGKNLVAGDNQGWLYFYNFLNPQS